MSELIRRLFVVAFCTAMIGTFVMSTLPAPPTVPGSDKLHHAVGFAVLTALAVMAFRRTSLWTIGLALAGYGALIEFAQMIPGLNRYADIADWYADAAAVALVLLVAAVIRGKDSAKFGSGGGT